MADSVIRVVIQGDKTGYSSALSGAASDAEAAGARVDSTVDGITTKTGGLFTKLGSSISNISPVLAAPFTKLGESFDSAESHGNKAMSALSSVGGATLLGLGAGFVAVSAVAIKMGMDFQKSESQFASSADISVAAADKIGTALLHTAGTSIYTGAEMLQALTPVAPELEQLSGHALTVGQSLTFMKQMSDLAEASNESLGTVTGAVAGVMRAFSSPLKDTTADMNAMFEASRLGGTTIANLASTMERLKARMGIAAPSIQTLSATLVDLSEHGVTGSRGLLVVNSAMNTLLSQTPKETDSLKLLGVNVFDASGKFVGMGSVIDQLQPKLATMTQQQQLQTLGAIFGNNAAKALLTTIDGGAASYDHATAAVSRHNAVTDAAAKQSDTLSREFEMVKATIEDLVTEYGTKLLPVINTLIHDVQDTITWFTKHKDVALALAGVIGGALSVAVGVFAVNKIGSMIQSTSKAITSLEQFGSKAITAAQNMLGLGSQTETTAGEVQASATEQQAALEETAATTTTTTATIQSSLVELGAAVEALTTQIQAAAVQISSSFGEIGTSASVVAGDFSADMTEMEGQLALFRGEAETPIVMPPVVPGGVAGAGVAGAEGAGAGALGGEEVAGGAAAGGGAAGLGSAVLPVAAMVAAVVVLGKLLGGVSPQIKQYTDAVAKSEAAANSAKSVDSLTASLQALEAEQPRATGYIKSGAAAIGLAGTSMQTTSAYYALWTNNMRAAGTAGDSLSQSIKRVLTALASAGTGLSVPQTQAVAKGDPIAQHYLSTIASSMAKDASIKAQATTFAGMLSQLSGLKAGSAQYEQALKGIQQTGDKWYPEFAKDKTAAQFAQTTDKIYAAAVVTNTKLEATVKDQSLKSAESHLASLQSQLSKETTQGASKATLDSTKGLINTELGHIATIHSLTTQLHKDSTAISVGKSLEQVTTKAGTDTQSKLDNVSITKIPGLAASGSIKVTF